MLTRGGLWYVSSLHTHQLPFTPLDLRGVMEYLLSSLLGEFSNFRPSPLGHELIRLDSSGSAICLSEYSLLMKLAIEAIRQVSHFDAEPVYADSGLTTKCRVQRSSRERLHKGPPPAPSQEDLTGVDQSSSPPTEDLLISPTPFEGGEAFVSPGI
ncbi:hypothetical protein NE237_022863 [Protea cynaroides]|uniref:Uncharacterized protein n=1 Tax=Protea cynaroides TaxID=273540 RepID=A0A9Q0HBS5_9MAGN|nr:hypothetical protein NE237_022863 [Protea cynaroides]